jgi:hypothetical protein
MRPLEKEIVMRQIARDMWSNMKTLIALWSAYGIVKWIVLRFREHADNKNNA